MSDDIRFSRLEGKVDKIDEKVNQTREDMHEMRTELRVHTATVERHVMSDERIIKRVKPLLDEMAYKKKKKEERKEKLKTWSMRVGLIAASVSIVFGITRIIGS